MEDLERKLLGATSKAVMGFLEDQGYPTKAKEIRELRMQLAFESLHTEAIKEFDPVMVLMETAELESSLEHTGGGIYVLYHYLTLRGQDGPFVGITHDGYRAGPTRGYPLDPEPSDQWLVCGYRDHNDDGSFQRYGVPTNKLIDVISEITDELIDDISEIRAEALKEQVPTSYVIPGEFIATRRGDGKMDFRFLPSAGNAGYFGLAAYRVTDGGPPDNEQAFWDTVANSLESNAIAEVYWEG